MVLSLHNFQYLDLQPSKSYNLNRKKSILFKKTIKKEENKMSLIFFCNLFVFIIECKHNI
jgi:hypothetical protein